MGLSEAADRRNDIQRGGGVQEFFLKKGMPHPPKIARTEGIYMWDEQGNRYIDVSSGPIASNIGHSNPKIVQAITDQAQRAAFAFPLSFQSQANLDFEQKLLALSGPPFEHAFVVSGGSEAVETCLKFARTYTVQNGQPERTKFISRRPSYHGATLGCQSLTGDVAMEALFGPIANPSIKIPAPLSYRFPEEHTAESHAQACVEALETAIIENDPETVLGFVIEPVAGLSGGASYGPDWYYKEIRRICDRYGILLIFDEVLTGSGRTGKFLAAHHWPDALPDIVAISKGIGCGYLPVGAMLATDKMVTTIAESGGFPHAQTYTTTPLGCAVGSAILDEIVDNDLMGNAERVGTHLRDRLSALIDRTQIVGDVRGKGLLLAIEIVGNQATKEMIPLEINSPQRIGQIGMEVGLSLYPRRTNNGKFGDWLMITPPMTITHEQVDDLADRLEATLLRFQQELISTSIL